MDSRGTAPRDLKVFVLHGTPTFIMGVANRFGVQKKTSSRTQHVLVDTAGRALAGAYSRGKNSLAEYGAGCRNLKGSGADASNKAGVRELDMALDAGLRAIREPGYLRELLDHSRLLAARAAATTQADGRALAQLRVDFFVVGANIYFSELTFYTGACTSQWWEPRSFDALLGHLVATPQSAITPMCLADRAKRSCNAQSRRRRMMTRARPGIYQRG
jgi:hypothetical protein